MHHVEVLGVSRAWAGPALIALVVGLALLGRVVVTAVRVLPQADRDAYGTAWRATRRPIATTGVVLVWTLVYALYSLSLPTLGPPREVTVAAPRDDASTVGDVVDGAPTSTTTVRLASRPAFGPLDASSPPTTVDARPGATPSPEPPVTCALADAGAAVAEVQAAAEQLTGRRLGAELSLVVEALAGCGDAENAALSLLGPVNQLLNDAGVPALPLPAIPELDLPKVPEAIAAPLRPAVFQACGQLTPQLLTVAAVAPVARISVEDALRVLRYVTAVCSAFAPESS